MGRTILVPLDGSAGSEAILPAVERIARVEGLTVRLLHVAAPVEVLLVDGHVVRYVDQEVARIRDRARVYLMGAAATLGVAAEVRVRFGDPVEEIIREAGTGEVELIAMATHRRTGLKRLLERSVADRVKRATRVPLLLVRHGARRTAA
jgi:nucleotide-binding universal stress UspA family protein